MSMLRRVGFFLLVNMMIMFTVGILSAIINTFLFGEAFPPESQFTQLILWSVLWGMGGAFISLLMSKFLAKRMYQLKMLDPKTASGVEREFLDMVYSLARNAKLEVMPEVGIYQSPEMNAFATGPSRKNSLVAMSSGLLSSMNKEQVRGVLGHEVAHIANGDMVTMTLVQGVINSFVLFLARILAGIVSSTVSKSRDGNRMIEFILFQVFQIALGLLGSLVVSYYSRLREYRADQGGARYAGKDNMISALEALKMQAHFKLPAGIEPKSDSFANFKIAKPGGGMMMLFSSHPPLDERIARLRRGS